MQALHRLLRQVRADDSECLIALDFDCSTFRPLQLSITGTEKHAVVVGGGWAGFGAAYALLKAGVKVTVLDASETPGGLSSGWRTPGGRSVEAGIKG